MDAEIRPRRGRQKTKASSRKKPVSGRAASDDAGKKLLRAEMLLSITRELAGTDTLNDVLVKMVDITSRETDCERGTLFLMTIRPANSIRASPRGTSAAKSVMLNTNGIAGHVFTTGSRRRSSTTPIPIRASIPTSTSKPGFTTRNILCAPVRTVKGEIIGVAQALNKKDGAFTQEDLALLEAMTTQATLALRSAQFIERMKAAREQEMEFLDVVARHHRRHRPGHRCCRRSWREAARMLEADRSTLFLNDEKTNELFSRVAQGLGSVQIRLPNHLGIAGAVFTTGKTINIPYAYADLRFNPAFDKRTGYFTRSILCVPVVNKYGKIIGVTQV